MYLVSSDRFQQIRNLSLQLPAVLKVPFPLLRTRDEEETKGEFGTTPAGKLGSLRKKFREADTTHKTQK